MKANQRFRNDAALSDMIGTSILLAITVALVGVSASALYPAIRSQPAAPATDINAAAQPAAVGSISLTHAGGDALDRADLTVQVINGSTRLYDAPFPGTGAWSLGQKVDIPLTVPLSGGEHLEVQLVSAKHHAVVSTIPLDVPQAGAGLGAHTFWVSAITPDPVANVTPLSTTRIVAFVEHEAGSTAISDAWIDLAPLNGSAREPLYDDGTHGDAVAGDLYYTTYVEIPPDAPTGLTSLALGADAVDGSDATPAMIWLNVSSPLTMLAGGNASALSVLTNLTNATTIQQIQQFLTSIGGSSTGGSTLNDTLLQQLEDAIAALQNATSITDLNSTTIQEIQQLINATGAGNSTILQELQNIINALGNTTTLQDLTNITNLPFAGIPELREPNPFAPTHDVPNKLVTVDGKNFSYVNTVSFVASNGDAYGVSWFLVNDTELKLVTPSSAPADKDYFVSVAGPVGNDTSNEKFHLDAPLNTATSPPSITNVAPGSGRSNDEIVVTGTNLSFVRALTLTNGSTVLSASFWTPDTTGGSLHFLVPPGARVGDYVLAVNSPGGTAQWASLFHVMPAADLVISSFTPASGVPFTQVNVTGSGFSNAVLVTLGGVNVAYWITSDTSLSFLTHAGVPLGADAITVFNLTGSRTKCCFNALPDPNPKEYAVYPTNLLSQVAFTVQKFNGSTGSGNAVTSTLKFNLTNESIVLNGVTMHLTGVTLEWAPLKPGQSIGTAPLTVSNAAVPNRLSPLPCGPPLASNRAGVYAFKWDNQTIPNYAKDFATYQFFYVLTWTGAGSAEFDITIGSNDPSQYFKLKPLDQTKTVMDGINYDWPSTFTSCAP